MFCFDKFNKGHGLSAHTYHATHLIFSVFFPLHALHLPFLTNLQHQSTMSDKHIFSFNSPYKTGLQKKRHQVIKRKLSTVTMKEF